MCQAAMRRLLNHFESCQVRKVASLLTEALSRPCGRKRGTRFGSSRDTSRFGDPGSDRASHSLLRVAPEAYAEERGAARADQGGVRGRVRAGCAGKGLRGGGREGAQGAPWASRAP